MKKPETHKEYLQKDQAEKNTVKLDFFYAPWEITGDIISVGEKTFVIRTAKGDIEREIEHIQHYRRWPDMFINIPMDRTWYMHGYGWVTEPQLDSSCRQYGWRKEKDVVIGVEGLPIGWRKGCKPDNYTHVSFPLPNPYHNRAR